MVNSIAFTTFVINVAMEGLCEKYGDEVNLDRQNWIILKNKKYLGTLQRHQIQQVNIFSMYIKMKQGCSRGGGTDFVTEYEYLFPL